MSPRIAILVFVLVILGLFILDRNRESRTSPALWMPIIWLSISASRMVSQWFGVGIAMESPDQYLEGSPFDRAIFMGLMAGGLMVLVRRGRKTGAILGANGPILLFFLYCAFSILWSDYPLVAFKRWTKALGNVVMVLVVLTNPDPSSALKRLLTRSGFLLVPLSLLLIKYYPELGRYYDDWTGMGYYAGVGGDKNALGVICLISGLGSFYCFLGEYMSTDRSRRVRQLIAHGSVLAMVLWLFQWANSATSFGCFIIGCALICLTKMRQLTLKPMAVHLLVLSIVFVSVYGIIVDTNSGLAQVMGRNATLSGRTDLWQDLLQLAVDPWFGAGFESFWLGDRAKLLWAKYYWHPNQAHNGYLETYLALGWIGVGFLGFVMAWGYRNVISALRRDPEGAGINVAFFMVALIYNLTEAAFKGVHPVWIVFLLGVTIVPELSRRKNGTSYHVKSSQVRHIEKPVHIS